MIQATFRAFFLCVVIAVALVSARDATLASSRNEDVSSSVALSGMCCILQVVEDIILATLYDDDDDDGDKA